MARPRLFARLQTPDSEHGGGIREPECHHDPASSAEKSRQFQGTLLTSGSAQYKWIHLNFYDTREGERRENAVAGNHMPRLANHDLD